jgi:hypothetical protein
MEALSTQLTPPRMYVDISLPGFSSSPSTISFPNSSFRILYPLIYFLTLFYFLSSKFSILSLSSLYSSSLYLLDLSSSLFFSLHHSFLCSSSLLPHVPFISLQTSYVYIIKNLVSMKPSIVHKYIYIYIYCTASFERRGHPLL